MLRVRPNKFVSEKKSRVWSTRFLTDLRPSDCRGGAFLSVKKLIMILTQLLTDTCRKSQYMSQIYLTWQVLSHIKWQTGQNCMKNNRGERSTKTTSPWHYFMDYNWLARCVNSIITLYIHFSSLIACYGLNRLLSWLLVQQVCPCMIYAMILLTKRL